MKNIDRKTYTRPHAMRAASPFRYPGGKGFLTNYIQSKLEDELTGVTTYVEPFAGGAGAAINLLQRGVVEKVILNDLDIRIYSAWRAMLNENARFLEMLENTPVTLSSWKRFRTLVDKPIHEYSFDLGFATFFINRTSRSGIILGSGPIGGYEQSGKWKIDARFYRETMIRRCQWIGENSEKIHLHRKPAVRFLADCSLSLDDDKSFYFIDPPYVSAGSRLYFNGMSQENHAELAEFMQSGRIKNWMMTYDNHPIIQQLYACERSSLLEVAYSLRTARNERELLITSTHI